VTPALPRYLHLALRADRAAALASARLRHPALTPLALAVSYSGTAPMWGAAAVLLVVLARRGYGGIPDLDGLLAAMMGALIALLAGQLMKLGFKRARPFHALEGHAPVGMLPIDNSMPSNHASTAVALCVALLRIGHPWAAPVAAWAFCVTFSRYYIGVHYPSDLAVGVALGATCGMIDWAPVTDALLRASF
jgi:undecaprenyl-diphosphatase